MKMMQPLDLRVRQYGAVVWRSIACHYIEQASGKRGGGRERARCAHVGPRNLSDVEELVIAAYDDPIFDIGTFFFVDIFSREETTRKGGKRAGNIIIFELVHFPAGNLDRIICGCFIVGTLDELWFLRRELIESFC